MKREVKVFNKKEQLVATYITYGEIGLSDNNNYIFFAELRGIQVFPANVFTLKIKEV